MFSNRKINRVVVNNTPLTCSAGDFGKILKKVLTQLSRERIVFIVSGAHPEPTSKELTMSTVIAIFVSTSARAAFDEYAQECAMAPVWDAQEREAAKAERIAQLVESISNPASYREACDNSRKASDNLNRLYYGGVCEGDEWDVAYAVYWAAKDIEDSAWYRSDERAAAIAELDKLEEYISNPANKGNDDYRDVVSLYSDIHKDVYGYRPRR